MRPKKIYVTIYGVTKTIRQWANEYDLSYRTIYDRKFARFLKMNIPYHAL